ncbi:1,4-alpha-glucan branching protein [Nocardia sp. XZ_19_385]|uniref:maltokinase N-terminal cap-like domain-containing protein n=1 Tax=Nocardia sp. XZ_19_385 TaxID=2769488 RepID=UPI0018901941|nr:1,4-alpha-glucan branching protein [Nocardia sp. XZ_19_385]
MAVVHNTTMEPTKLELLTLWLPQQEWFRGTRAPALRKAGGFRLDDPAGEVGIEFMIVLDTSEYPGVAYHVPMTYRGAPLPGAEPALIGTSEHGVLGTRWIYDGAFDEVLVAQALALLTGKAQAQDQNASDALDPTVEVSAAPAPALTVRVVRTPQDQPASDAVGHVTAPWKVPGGTQHGVLLEALA